MAADVQGTAHVFGIDEEITNLSITGITAAHGFELNETVEDEFGVTQETRRDNRKKDLTLTARMTSAYTMPNIGDAITTTGLGSPFNDTFEITNVQKTFSNTDYVELEITAEKYEAITVS